MHGRPAGERHTSGLKDLVHAVRVAVLSAGERVLRTVLVVEQARGDWLVLDGLIPVRGPQSVTGRRANACRAVAAVCVRNGAGRLATEPTGLVIVVDDVPDTEDDNGYEDQAPKQSLHRSRWSGIERHLVAASRPIQPSVVISADR